MNAVVFGSNSAAKEISLEDLAETIIVAPEPTGPSQTGIRQRDIHDLQKKNGAKLRGVADPEFSIEASSEQEFLDVFGVNPSHGKFQIIHQIFRLGISSGSSPEIILKSALSQLISHPLALQEVYQRYRRELAPKKQDYVFETFKKFETSKEETFYLINKIGQGAMGVVYIVVDPKHPRDLQIIKSQQVAVEMDQSTSRWQSAPGEKKDLFDRHTWEVHFAQELSKLGVTHTVAEYISHGKSKVLDEEGKVTKQPFLRQAFKPGMTMEEFCKACAGKELSDQEFSDIVVFALAGVAKLHSEKVQIVHRDLKPANLLVTVDGVTVLDFGLAKDKEGILAQMAADQDNDTLKRDITLDQEVLGSPAYMSPEQAMGAKNAGPMSDCYSLCCVLYYLKTGETIFPKIKGVQKVLFAQAQMEPVEAIAYVQKDLPPRHAEVFVRGFSKDPAKRLTCEEMIERFLPDSSFAGTDAQAFIDGVNDGTLKLPVKGNILTALKEGKSSLPAGWIATFLDERERKEKEASGDEGSVSDEIDSLASSELPLVEGPLSAADAIALLTERARQFAVDHPYLPPSNDVASLSQRTETSPHSVFNRTRSKFFPWAAAGVVVVGASIGAAAHFMGKQAVEKSEGKEPVAKKVVDPEVDPSSQEKITPAQPVVQLPNAHSPVVDTNPAQKLSPEQIFPPSKYCTGTVDEHGNLTELVLFPGTSSEVKKTDMLTTYTSGGIVHMFQCNFTLEQLSQCLGVTEAELPISAEYRTQKKVPAIGIFDRDTGEYVISLHPNSRISGSETDAHLYSDFQSPLLLSSLGPNTIQSPGRDFRHDTKIRTVSTKVLSQSADPSSPSPQNIFLTVGTWKKNCDQAQAQKH